MPRKVAFACAIKYNGQGQFGGFGQDLPARRLDEGREWLQRSTPILNDSFLSPSEMKPVGEYVGQILHLSTDWGSHFLLAATSENSRVGKGYSKLWRVIPLPTSTT